MLYCDLTRPHLWPTSTLVEARLEHLARLKAVRTSPKVSDESRQQVILIDAILDKRQVPLKKRTPRT